MRSILAAIAGKHAVTRLAVYAFIVSSSVACFINQTRPMAVDFKIYLEAAKGNYDYWVDYPAYKNQFGFNPTWLYPNYTAVIWKPFLLFKDERDALLAWFIILTGAYLFIAKKLLEIPYGWILVILTHTSTMHSFANGNVIPLLVSISFNPFGALLAGMVKPFCLCFVFLVPIFEGVRSWTVRAFQK